MAGSRSIWVGFDPREAAAFAVARKSLAAYARTPIPIRGISLDQMRRQGRYTRPTEIREGRLWDTISEAPMATEFAISRFLTPHLAKQRGWALFVDGDVMARADINRLFDECDLTKAVMCVQHEHAPVQTTKMDGQLQTVYPRKNWSSVMAFNCEHPANRALTVELINTVPGRDLHRFCWLEDDQIGSLDPAWNFLVGHSDPSIDPKLVHFTDGVPFMAGYEDVPFAQEWRDRLMLWAA